MGRGWGGIAQRLRWANKTESVMANHAKRADELVLESLACSTNQLARTAQCILLDCCGPKFLKVNLRMELVVALGLLR